MDEKAIRDRIERLKFYYQDNSDKKSVYLNCLLGYSTLVITALMIVYNNPIIKFPFFMYPFTVIVILILIKAVFVFNNRKLKYFNKIEDLYVKLEKKDLKEEKEYDNEYYEFCEENIEIKKEFIEKTTNWISKIYYGALISFGTILFFLNEIGYLKLRIFILITIIFIIVSILIYSGGLSHYHNQYNQLASEIDKGELSIIKKFNMEQHLLNKTKQLFVGLGKIILKFWWIIGVCIIAILIFKSQLIRFVQWLVS